LVSGRVDKQIISNITGILPARMVQSCLVAMVLSSTYGGVATSMRQATVFHREKFFSVKKTHTLRGVNGGKGDLCATELLGVVFSWCWVMV